MNCPKCQTETLGEFSVDRVTVDRCASCAGIWFDAHDLVKLLAEEASHVASLRRGHVKEEVEGKKGRCPRDGADLLRVYSSIEPSVILDACPDCRGIWLDGGEFDKLFAARKA
ncbi:MAG TPA: zf-TFIIB domain-containing protein [Candidatus Binatia bacterium]|jgi:Zn-finger nucleic acid-binding protein